MNAKMTSIQCLDLLMLPQKQHQQPRLLSILVQATSSKPVDLFSGALKSRACL